MLLIECDQYFTVRAAYCCAISKSVVEGLRCQADGVNDQGKLARRNRLADLVFNLAEDHLGGLNPGSRLRTHMEPDLPRVDGRKEIPAHERQEHECSRHSRDRQDERAFPVRQYRSKRARVTFLNPQIPPIERVVDALGHSALRSRICFEN